MNSYVELNISYAGLTISYGEVRVLYNYGTNTFNKLSYITIDTAGTYTCAYTAAHVGINQWF